LTPRGAESGIADSPLAMTASALPTPDFSRFPRYAQLTELLQAYAAARPDVVELRSIGKSHEGRDIWLLALTRKATGVDTDKPAFCFQGHPEASPGPHDIAYLFDRFIDSMTAATTKN